MVVHLAGQLAAPPLGRAFAQQHAVGRQRHPDRLVGHHVLHGEAGLGHLGLDDLCAPGIVVLLLESQQLILDHAQDLVGIGQQVFQVGDALEQLLVFVLQLLALQRGQPLEGHVQDRLGLDLAELELGIKLVRAVSVVCERRMVWMTSSRCPAP